MTPKTIMLTGATGFLGSHLLRAFLDQGHKVVILKRSHSNLSRIEDALGRVTAYDWDVVDIEQPFKEQGKVDFVIHTATCYGRQGETAATVFEANVSLPLRLLETAALFNTDTFFNTDTILYEYLNAYALSKKQFKDWGILFAKMEKIRFVNLRLEHMYGPGDDASKFTTHVIKSCLAHVSHLDLTAGEQKRDFVFIDDVVSAYGTLLQEVSSQQGAFQEYGIGSGQAVTIREFVETAHKAANSKTRLNFGAVPYRSNEIMHSEADTATLKSLGWSCQVGLWDGLRRTIEKEHTV